MKDAYGFSWSQIDMSMTASIKSCRDKGLQEHIINRACQTLLQELRF